MITARSSGVIRSPIGAVQRLVADRGPDFHPRLVHAALERGLADAYDLPGFLREGALTSHSTMAIR